ncbi:PilZ domain-containing protein [Mesorhizobium sp. M0027]|uniref:PilZ domain-containing protein n=1 Tax=unclassified Mesorhizobium TaxID=325217 RepID=UPI003334C199
MPLCRIFGRNEMSTPKGPQNERRSHARAAVLKDGTIITENATIRCSVRNQHAHGCELHVDPSIVIPERFILHIPADDTRYRAALRWRKNDRLGVQIY